MKYRPAYDIRKHPVRHFFDETWDARRELFTLMKRLAIIGVISWGGVKYLTQNGRRTVSEGLRAQLEAINNTKPVKNFHEGVEIIKEAKRDSDYRKSPEGRAHAEAWRKEQARRRKELKEMDIDPTIEWVGPDDPRYPEALKDYRELMK